MLVPLLHFRQSSVEAGKTRKACEVGVKLCVTVIVFCGCWDVGASLFGEHRCWCCEASSSDPQQANSVIEKLISAHYPSQYVACSSRFLHNITYVLHDSSDASIQVLASGIVALRCKDLGRGS